MPSSNGRSRGKPNDQSPPYLSQGRTTTHRRPPIPPRLSSKRQPTMTLSPSLIPLPLFHRTQKALLAPTHPSLNKPLPPPPRGDDSRAREHRNAALPTSMFDNRERCMPLTPPATPRTRGGGEEKMVREGKEVGEKGVLVEEFSVSTDKFWSRMPGIYTPHENSEMSPETVASRNGEDVEGEEVPVEPVDKIPLRKDACWTEMVQVYHKNGNVVLELPDTKGRRREQEKVGSLGMYFDWCFAGMADVSDGKECACSLNDSDEDLLAKIGPMFPERTDDAIEEDWEGGDGDLLQSGSNKLNSRSEAIDLSSKKSTRAASLDAQSESKLLKQNLRRVDPAGNLRNLRKRYDPDAESAYSRSICGSSIKAASSIASTTEAKE
ncbi:MAG: hypothetical protein Q9183_003920 [Haloplaca sp. 2 TL-2023]